MKIVGIVCLGLVFFQTAFLRAQSPCTDCELGSGGTSSKALSTVKKTSELLGVCDTPEAQKAASEILKKMVAQETTSKVVGTFDTPSARTGTSVTYKFPEKKLNPGEALYFAVPADLSYRGVRFMILGHRQRPEEDTGKKPDSKWDEVPGLTSVQIHGRDLTPDKAWRYWGGDASGSKGAKFAESRNTLEIENLYSWPKTGHRSVVDDSTSHEVVKADVVRVVSMGKDPVYVGELTLKVLPDTADQNIEKIFSSGTQFGNPNNEDGYKYGGGQAYEGTFPGALALGGYSFKSADLPMGWTLQNGVLGIPVPEGKTITAVEMAIGDSHPDKVKNSDGGFGTQGWAKLSVGIGSDESNVDWFMSRENVPPEGVLMGNPSQCGRVTKKNDRVFIRVDNDKAYLMGVRIGLKSTK